MAFKGVELKYPTIFAIGKRVVVFRRFGRGQCFANWTQFAFVTATCILIGSWSTNRAFVTGGRGRLIVVRADGTGVAGWVCCDSAVETFGTSVAGW